LLLSKKQLCAILVKTTRQRVKRYLPLVVLTMGTRNIDYYSMKYMQSIVFKVPTIYWNFSRC